MLVAVEEQGFENGNRIELLALDGVKNRKIYGERVRIVVGSAAKNIFTKQDRLSECLLGMVVGGRHAVDFEESEEPIKIAFGVEYSQAEFLSIGIRQWVCADGVKTFVETGYASKGGAKRDQTGVALAAQFAGVGEKVTDVLAKRDRNKVALGVGVECNQFGNLSCLANEMGQTGLAMRRMNGVVAGIIIRHQTAFEGVAKYGDGHIAAARTVDVKKTEVRCSCIPEIAGFAVESPTGFIGMNDLSCSDFISKCGMVRFGCGGNLTTKRQGRCWHKRHLKQISKNTAHIPQGKFECLSQKNSRGLGRRPDLAVA